MALRHPVPAVLGVACLVLLSIVCLGGLVALATGARVSGARLVGPCDGYALATPDTYQTLALRIMPDTVKVGGRMGSDATPERVEAQLARIADLRVTFVPSVTDACLAAHVTDWLDYFERDARKAMERKAQLNGFASEYDKRRAEEEDQVRALAARLGVKR